MFPIVQGASRYRSPIGEWYLTHGRIQASGCQNYATALVASGADVKLVQSLMGHSSAAMTLDVYATCDPSRIRAASALVDGIFGN